MAAFLMPIRLTPSKLKSFKSSEKAEQQVMAGVRVEFPDVDSGAKWDNCFAVMASLRLPGQIRGARRRERFQYSTKYAQDWRLPYRDVSGRLIRCPQEFDLLSANRTVRSR